MKKTKAMLLIELSVLFCCSTILFLAISNGVSNQNVVINRMKENNDILLIMDSIASRVKLDLDSGLLTSDLNLKEYQGMLSNSNYKLLLNTDESGRLTILLGVEGRGENRKIERIYKREIKVDEK